MEKLIELVEKTGKDINIKLLKSLVQDIEEFNYKYIDTRYEVILDFNEESNDFSISIKNKKTKETELIKDSMSISQLDENFGFLFQYFYARHTIESDKRVFSKQYPKDQCVYGPASTMPCEICSATCEARAKDFIDQGKEYIVDEESGVNYFIDKGKNSIG